MTRINLIFGTAAAVVDTAVDVMLVVLETTDTCTVLDETVVVEAVAVQVDATELLTAVDDITVPVTDVV